MTPPAAQGAPVRVAYILGAARSGSTILSQVLGEVPGLFFAGELIHLWDESLLGGDPCGCGEPVEDCPVWSKVLREVFPLLTPEISTELLAIRDAEVRSHRVLTARIPGFDRGDAAHLARYRSTFEQLYLSIRETTGANVIVDSSKNAAHAAILAESPLVDVSVIHLVRDPRATAFSWLREVEGLGHRSPVKSSMQWNARNLVASMATSGRPGSYMRAHYEDFAADPMGTTQTILDRLDLPASPAANSLDPGSAAIHLSPNHSVHGNPRRFDVGTVAIDVDDEWRRAMGGERHLVTALTLPLLVRYGYRLRRRTRS